MHPVRASLLLCVFLAAAATAAAQETCAGGAVKDDGSPETGYGWVPSVVEGIFVQEFSEAELGGREMVSVCVSWLRTREDEDLDFDVVFYRQVDGIPAPAPYAVVPTRALAVPAGVASGGRFYDVDVTGVPVAGSTVYIGVRWNASVHRFFFVGVDTNPVTLRVEGFYIDERADEWTAISESGDPIFRGHRAMMIRARAEPGDAAAIPAVTPTGAALLALLVAALGVWLARRTGVS
jgi:hypothetical protein